MHEYILAKYIRLSVDDAVTDSLSISNQRRLLDKHIVEMNLPDTHVIEFVDNGYSGTTFERPAVQELLELVRCGKVDCILCKDFSRYGRNAVEMEYFVEKVFPLYRTRFISVDDRFDSDNFIGTTGGLDVAMKYILHEQYSRDLSEKVRSAKRIRMERGESITANAIYGYRKGESGKWEPDEEAAAIVQQIYTYAMEGLSPAKIRDRLFAQSIPTPREYQNIKREKTLHPTCMWTARMVRQTLTNEQYTGMYVVGKQRSKAVGSHNKIHTKKEEWIMIPDRHPAIIGKEIFTEVQHMQKYQRDKVQGKPLVYLLRGKIACGCCHYALSYDAIFDPVFRCHHTHADSAAPCHKMIVNVRELDEAVLAVIAKQIEVVLGCELPEVRVVKGQDQKVSGCEKEIQSFEAQRQKIYEQFVMDEINRDAYLLQKRICSKRIEELTQHLAMLKAEEQTAGALRKSKATAKGLMQATPRELVEKLIKKVYVSPGNQIRIEWLISDFAAPTK